MAIGISHAIPFGNKRSWSSYWTTLISATVVDQNINLVTVVFSKANTSLLASDFSIAGFTISNLTRSVDNKTLYFTLEEDVTYGVAMTLTLNIGAGFTHVITNSVHPAGWAFELPAVGVIDVPVNTTDNWVTTRSGGDPAVALSVVDITDAGEIAKIGSNKALQLVTGVSTWTTSGVKYAFPVGVKPINFLTHNICVWVKFVDGDGITEWSTSTELVIQLRETFAAAAGYSLATPSAEYKGAGWYAFSFTPIDSTTTVDLTNINELIVYVTKLATSCPTIQIGRIAIVPIHAKAQLTIMCDGAYLTHKNITDLLTTHGMRATIYTDAVISQLSVAQLLAIQAEGHQIGAYCGSWWGGSDLAGRLAILTAAQNFLIANGFTGYRHFVHGGTSGMTEEIWEGLFPKYADSCGYAMQQIASQYHKTYMPRYHQFNAANQANCTTRVNWAIENKGRIGVLCHDIAGVDWTAFEDWITNTILPMKNAGTLDVITVKEAFESV